MGESNNDINGQLRKTSWTKRFIDICLELEHERKNSSVVVGLDDEVKKNLGTCSDLMRNFE